MKSPKTLLERFFAKVTKSQDTECWLWVGSKNRFGYGKIAFYRVNGRAKAQVMPAHRVSWILHRGDIPDGLFVLHKCDVPSCVNPRHLFLGTQKDNMDDMRRKGRHGSRVLIGQQIGTSKITSDQALAIAEDRRNQIDIAADYGVSRSNVSSIKRGVTWGHVTGRRLEQ